MKFTNCQAAMMALLFLTPSPVHSTDPNMQRVLNLAYGDMSGPAITNYTQNQIYTYIKQIQPLSAIINFMLNVKPSNLGRYQPLLNNIVNTSKIPVYPALGKPDLTQYTINDSYYREIASGYRSFTDSIQIDGLQTYVDRPNSAANVKAMYAFTDWLSSIGFRHIQLNPWPIYPNHSVAYPFANPAVDSAMEQVMLDFTDPPQNTMYDPADPSNWKINPKKIQMILASNSTVRVIVNYENRPQEALLATLSRDAQIAAFTTTLKSINDTAGVKGRVHWTAPWSQNYDPIAQGTWGWIRAQFAAGNPP